MAGLLNFILPSLRVRPEDTFCSQYGSSTRSPQPPKRRRPLGVTIVAILMIVRILYALVVDIPSIMAGLEDLGPGIIYAGIGVDIILVLLQLVSIAGLLRLKDWGRKLTIASAWLGIVFTTLFSVAVAASLPVPMGISLTAIFSGMGGILVGMTIWAIIFTWYLTRSGVRAAFAALPPLTPTRPAPQRPTVVVKYCAHCGAEVEPGAVFCGHCGKPLTQARKYEGLREVAEQDLEKKQAEKMSRKRWAGVLVWLLVIFIFGYAGFISNSLPNLTVTWVLFLPLFVLLIHRVHRARNRWGWNKTEVKKIVLATSSLILLSAASVHVLTIAAQIGPGVSLRNADLSDFDLSRRDLHGADLSGADLTHADLSGANLRRVNLTNANLRGTNLRGADLTGAVLDGVVLEDTNLTDCIGITDNVLASVLDVFTSELPTVLCQRRIRLESREDIMASLKDVRLGEGVYEASLYVTNGGFHPVILLGGQGGTHTWSDEILEWEPMALRFAELVVFVGEEEAVSIQTCQYTPPPSITRYQHRVKVLLFSAWTGELVASEDIKGELPAHCPQTAPLGQTKIHGERVSFEVLRMWLADFVNPP